MDKIKSIGIMTGNSLDAFDAVLSEIDLQTKEVTMLSSVSLYMPAEISNGIRKLRVALKKANYNIEKVVDNPGNSFSVIHNSYLRRIVETVDALIKKAEKDGTAKKEEIDVIGFHGQTLGHFPPSIAEGKDPGTVQMGDGQVLADMIGIPVIYDFRSDDIMNGGEGAPLAPIYNTHLLHNNKDLKNCAFCNAGNTGNITVISTDTKTGEKKILGWDTGPFNHFPDLLMRTEQDNEPYDIDGILGRKGSLNMKLLNALFVESAVTRSGENFLLTKPPKSSDPTWYKMIKELEPGSEISFADRLRTVEYFSAYAFAYSLSFIPESIEFPDTFILCGGGWKNPIITDDFKNILSSRGVLLSQHTSSFSKLAKRIPKNLKIDMADKFGFSAKYMEAGVFADIAVSRILGEPYTLPSTTGALKPTICGVIRYPITPSTATNRVKALLKKYDSQNSTLDEGFADKMTGRATKGWQKRIKFDK